MGKKIKESERPAEFSRIRDIVFKGAGVRYVNGDTVDDEIYRRALRRFGLVDDSMKFQYPDAIGGYDFKSEEGITSFMAQAAKEYAEIDRGITADPASMKHDLWPLFTVEHNPKYQPFVDGELASIKMNYSQLSQILKAGEADIARARAAAKGTSLEGTVGSPFDLAESLMYTINLRYIQSLGYKLSGFKDKGAATALFDEVQRNLADGAPFKLSKEEQTAREMAELKSLSESNKSPVNSSGPRATPTSEGSAAPSINSTEPEAKPTKTASNSTINPAAAKSSETTAVTNSEGGVTSKTGELQAEKVVEATPSQAVNINLETKQAKPASAEPASNSTTVLNTSSATTINDTSAPSSVTNNSASSSSSVGATSDKKVLNVENTNNQSSSSTVNESNKEKEKGGFLSKVGNFAKKAGAALNLPSIAEIGGQAKGLFGATTANINSRISEVKESFTKNSKDQINPFSAKAETSTTNNSSNTTSSANPTSTSNSNEIIKTNTQTTMNVEQSKPSMTEATPASTTNQQTSTSASNTVLNTNTQSVASTPQSTSTTAQSTTPAPSQTGQPAAGAPGVNVNTDLSQLAQSIMRLERILISGIDVTIKDT